MPVNVSAIRVFCIFLAIIVVPSLMYVSLSGSSMAAGVLVVCLVIMLAPGSWRLPLRFIGLPVLFFAAAFTVHTTYHGVQVGMSAKHLFSAVLLALMFFCAGLLAIKIKRVPDAGLVAVLKLSSLLIVFLGYLSIVVPIDVLSYNKYAKSIFPFSEPSHYAITVSGILLATGFYLSPFRKGLLISTVLMFSVVYPSMLLLLLASIMLFSYYVHSFFKLIFVFFGLVGLLILFPYIGVDTSYYTDRLTLDASTSNLTALVYLQGWEIAYHALLQSYGVGLGFQNLGSLDPGYYGNKIFQVAGMYKNREDGGFLAAKIIGEFGVVGFGLLMSYVAALCFAALYNRKFIISYHADQAKALEIFPVSAVLSSSVLVAFSIEVFTRGYGYFSPGVLLAMTSVFLVTRKGRERANEDSTG